MTVLRVRMQLFTPMAEAAIRSVFPDPVHWTEERLKQLAWYAALDVSEPDSHGRWNISIPGSQFVKTEGYVNVIRHRFGIFPTSRNEWGTITDENPDYNPLWVDRNGLTLDWKLDFEHLNPRELRFKLDTMGFDENLLARLLIQDAHKNLHMREPVQLNGVEIIKVPDAVRRLGWPGRSYALKSEVASFVREIDSELQELRQYDAA